MKKNRYRYVSMDDGVWRMTRAQYVAFLEEAAKGEGFDVTKHGKLVAENVVRVNKLGALDFEALLMEEKENG